MKKTIIDIIAKEDKKNPYTDDQIAKMLNIRRDEVTQLRCQQDIPDSRRRREPYLLEELKLLLTRSPKISDRELTLALNNKGYTISRFTVGQLRKEYSEPMAAGAVAASAVAERAAAETAEAASEPQVASEPQAAMTGKAAAFHTIVGAEGTLKPQIQQAKAAVLYPPFGLHTLILGPTGSGKSFLAEAMYHFAVESGRLSPQAAFITFNCADYADNPQLLLSQLFGHVKGAFTGADTVKEGLVEKANGGVLFLDEIHRLPAEGQELLFYLIDKGKFRRMGETGGNREVQLMVIAATNENVESSLLLTFRRRIPMVIELPSLSERTVSERYELVREFISKEADRIGVKIKVSKPVLRTLLLYDCQGNVGQLRSDIQVACARGFLTYLNERHKYVEFYLLDLPLHARRGLSHVQSRNQEVEQLLKGDFVVSPGEKGSMLMQMEDLYVLPSAIYGFIEHKYQEMQAQGMTQEMINRSIGRELDTHFQQVAKKFNKYDTELTAKNLVDIVGHTILALAEKMVQVAEKKLGKLDAQLVYYLAIHVSATLERIQKGKTIINPQLDKVRQEYRHEYETAVEMVQAVQSMLSYTLPEDEIGFIAMYLRAMTQPAASREGRVGVLVMSHGNIASGMAEVVNCLLGVSHAKAMEMSLDERPEAALKRAIEMVKKIDEGKGVLILADMGSLITFGELITQKTNIPTRTVGRVDTVMVLEAVRRAILPNTTLHEIISSIDTDKVGLGRMIADEDKSDEYDGKRAIVTVCITGQGTALKIKRLIEKMVPEVSSAARIIPLGIAGQEDIQLQIQQLRANYEIAAIVGSVNPHTPDVPFISIEEMLSGRASRRIRTALSLVDGEEEAPAPSEEAKKRTFWSEMLFEELITIQPDWTTKNEALDAMTKLMRQHGYVDDGFVLDVYKREVMGHTLLAGGAAIPHGSPEHVIKPAVAVSILKEPITWMEEKAADIVVMMAFKEDLQQDVGEFLALLEDRSFVEYLAGMTNAYDMKAALMEGHLT